MRASKGSCSGIQRSKQTKKYNLHLKFFGHFGTNFATVSLWSLEDTYHAKPTWTFIRILLYSNKQTNKNGNLKSQFMNNFRQNLLQWARGALRTLTVRNLRGPRGLSSEVTSPYGDLVGFEAVRGSWGFSEEKRPHFSPSVADKLWLCEGLFLYRAF